VNGTRTLTPTLRGISPTLEAPFLLFPLHQRGARGDFEGQPLQAKRDHVPITTSFRGVLACQVLRAIHFDDRSCPWGKDIHNVLTDGFPPIELDAKTLCIPPARPKSGFTVCQIPPQSKSPPFFKRGTQVNAYALGGEGAF
jgi:hypothetical protein